MSRPAKCFAILSRKSIPPVTLPHTSALKSAKHCQRLALKTRRKYFRAGFYRRGYYDKRENGIDNPIGAKTGQTACHVCQDSNKFKLLCKARGVDDCDEIIDADGNTPLHIAAKTDNLDLVLTLVEHGCTPDKLNNSSRTPIDIAKTFMNDEIYLVLQQLKSKVCFCKQKAESMLRAFCEEYPYFSCVLDYRAKVETNIALIKMSREREKNEESSSGFTFEALQKKKGMLATEDQDALLKREKEEEDEIMKTMHASDVDGRRSDRHQRTN